MQDTEKKPKGGAGRGQGRKAKSGEFVQFRPSVEVWEILKEQKNKTAYIEMAVISHHNKIQSMIEEADKAVEEFVL